MKDIAVIGSSYAQGSFVLARHAYDRVRAAIYFANECAELAQAGSERKARWHARAALSEFKSVFDVLPTDFREKGVDKIWGRCQFKEELDSNVLVRALSKIRDYAIHTSRLKSNHRAVHVRFIDAEGEKPETYLCLFIGPLQREHSRDDLGGLTDEEIEWFNRQAEQWPVDLLVKEGIFQASQQIAGFFATYGERIAV